ncbi:MAG: division/cell wall cluster transcriptional repressor MraZ [Treponema sp.]|jgi:MraZ protein|nr:division/cell wall cluster transcriptional repressor MraZ [Treponema sp.]
MLSGEYNVTLDDTGRIALPHCLREILEKDKVVLTKGADTCLWLYSVRQWEEQEALIISTTNRYSSRGRTMLQHFIGPKKTLDMDKQGRILIPPTLRDHAGLSKECIVLGQCDYVEIWAVDRYRAHLEASVDDFKAGLEELGGKIMMMKDVGNDGNSAHPGITGGSSAVSRSEGQA